ncbi:MAG: hypothetical protein MRY59_04300 [Aquisalinus sp.]|nr:hypothetical protein [Aquisalinus sp.]
MLNQMTQNQSDFMSYLNVCDFHELQGQLKSISREKVKRSFDFIAKNRDWIATAEIGQEKFVIWVGVTALLPSIKVTTDGPVWQNMSQYLNIDLLDSMLSEESVGHIPFPETSLTHQNTSLDAVVHLGSDILSAALLAWVRDVPVFPCGKEYFTSQLEEMSLDQILEIVETAFRFFPQTGDACIL